MNVEIGAMLYHVPTQQYIQVKSRNKCPRTGMVKINGKYRLVDCNDPERDLTAEDLQQIVVCVEQMIDSGIYELDLLSVFNDRQRRQIWAALSIEQRECLKRAKESQDASEQNAA